MNKLRKFRFTKKTAIILAIAVLAVAGVIFSCTVNARTKGIKTNIGTTVLKKGSLQDTTSISGTIHSRDTCNVYTTQAYPVAKVSVSVGDKVKKGDVLAVLDSSLLEKDVQQQQYAAKSSSDTASLSMESAKDTYDSTLYNYSHDLNADVIAAKSSLDTAKSALQAEKNTYASDQFSYQKGQISKMDLDQEQQKLNQAQSAYDNAAKSLNAAKTKAQQDLLTARNAYQQAVSKNEDKSQQAALEKLQESLGDCIVTAPADGTVTVNNASVGIVPAGILFKIENPDNLQVEVEVKEIDADKVKPGEKVTVTTDASGDEKFAAAVTSIAPAATEKTQGTSNVTFTTKVGITDKNPALRIGMKAKANIVLQEKDDVFVVNYDSLVQKDNGTTSVYVAQKSGTQYKVVEIPVKTGLENDVAVEISGTGLKDGLQIIDDPENVKVGDAVQIKASAPSSAASGEE